MTTTWRRLPFETGEAERLLARGAELLDALEQEPVPMLRWYRSRDTALVLGRGQQRSLVTADRVPVVGRFSGGGAVLMDPGLLCLDVLVPAGHPLLAGSLSAVFGRVGEAWATALSSLGVADVAVHRGPATTPRGGTDRDRLLAAVCYATVGHGEVTAGGRKVVGLAQRRRRPGALVQCGLLRRWEPGSLLQALGADPADPQVAAAATGLDDLMQNHVGDDAVAAAVNDALEGVHTVT